MDYEKKYKEALEWARKVMQGKIGFVLDDVLEKFPELAESEEERIRKEMIFYFTEEMSQCSIQEHADKMKKFITWLEKQGSLKDIVDRHKDSWYNEGKIAGMAEGLTDDEKYQQGWHDALEKQGEQKPQGKSAIEAIKEERVDNTNKVEPKFKIGDKIVEKDFDECGCGTIIDIKDGKYIFDNGGFICIEEQGLWKLIEQKPTDKGEPKFHKGEWVTNGDYTWKIVEVKPLDYILQSQDGNIVDDTISYVDEQFHSFTIEDAKDGDILINKSNNKECPFIFKKTKPSHIKTDVLNPLTVLGYCGIGGAGFTKGSGWGDTANCTYYPATKEQRDLLFQKMKEAGYEWDAEKKELRKISQEYPLTPDECIKPTWSEEDELHIRELENLVKQVWATAEHENDKDTIHKMSDLSFFLKTFKPQLKQEWSKEDEEMYKEVLTDIIYAKNDLEAKGCPGLSKRAIRAFNWFSKRYKSLRPQNWTKKDKDRYISCLQRLGTGNPEQPETINSKWFKEHVYPQSTWKPSNEQMKALWDSIPENVKEISEREMLLDSLYQDLKKLMEE